MSFFGGITQVFSGDPKKGLAVQGLDDLTKSQILKALEVVMDPDLGKNIVELGFVQGLEIRDKVLFFKIELTTPACPVKEQIKAQAEAAVLALQLPNIDNLQIEMTARTRGPKVSAPNTSASLGKVKNIIAVASGKGGVGKSATAVHLAYALAATGAKVGLLDADVYGPSVPLMTNLKESPTAGNNQMIAPPSAGGVRIMSVGMFAQTATILRGPMAAQIVKQFLSQVDWGDLDYLVVDYPPGTGDIQLTISQIAPLTAAVVVTTPQEVALIDVRKCLGMFDTLKVPVLGVVETMSYFVCDGCTKKHFIFPQGGAQKLEKEFGVPLLGQIPMDPEIGRVADSGSIATELNSTSPGIEAYKVFAGEVARHLSVLNSENEDGVLRSFSLNWQ